MKRLFELFSKTEKKSESDNKDFLKFYEISGQDKITEHAFERYQKDKNQDEAIRERVQKSKEEEQKDDEFLDKVENASDEEKVLIIKSEIEKPHIIAWRVSLIDRLPEKDQVSLRKLLLERVKKGLKDPDTEVQTISMKLVREVPNEECFSLIGVGLEHPNTKVQRLALDNILYSKISQKEKAALIGLGLKSSNVAVWEKSAEFINLIHWESDKKQEKILLQNILFEKIKKELGSSSAEIQGKLVKNSIFLREEQWIILEPAIMEKIKIGLESSGVEVQVIYPKLIQYVPPEKRASLIRLGLESPSIETQKKSAEMILVAPDSERPSLIELGLKNPNIEVRRGAARAVGVVLSSSAWWSGKAEIEKFADQIIKMGLGEELVKPRLYEFSDIDKRNFSRQKFIKTGSETTLIGGELKDKTIIRHIEPEAFLQWQRLYEDYNLWKKAGFDYVPIEPIQSYRLNKDGLVDVFSGILDITLADWRSRNGKDDLLKKQEDKILRVLEKLKITHGHTHENNFCLRFFRDEKGLIDFQREPRLYLIDFDQVTSSSAQSSD